MSAPIKVGIVGYGYASKTFHVPFIATLPEYELTAISSSNPAKVSADWPDVAVVASPEELFSNPEIELVIIPTPNDTHYPLASEALAAGKHVVVDKPFTITVEEAKALQKQAQDTGKLLSVYHNRRWDAGYLTLKKLLADGSLGDIKYYESHFDRYRPVTRQRWRESAVAGGGIWYDLGPHLLDQALQFFGKPKSITADLGMLRPGAEAVDYFHSILEYADKKVILHSSTVAAAESPLYVVHGMKGSYVKYGLDSQEDCLKSGQLPTSQNWGEDKRNGSVTMSQGDDLITQELVNEKGNYGGYYLAIHDAIRNGALNPVLPQEAIDIMKVIEAGILSNKEKRTINIDF
ncbi:scyllo-inositol 2-dehydrogenase (NADP+) [Providencia alcalifaciens]|nr:scyllo-inositol 2-dehydrogenase (NADP+) [Providencia alcalifaciens]